MENEILKKKTNEIESYVISLRHEFHKNPEISGNEVWTSKRIRKEIDKIGIPYEMVSKTGLIAILDTGKKGKSIVLRSDIDALPMQENPNNLN